MFACSVYELTPEFEDNITQEFIDNIKRLRHHASLGLWCGNNEMESFVNDREWVSKPSEVRDYLFMYERIIPQVLKKYDPETFYWPSSPSSGGSFDEPQDPTGEMYISGRYGMETNHFLNTGNITSAISLNLVSRHSLP